MHSYDGIHNILLYTPASIHHTFLIVKFCNLLIFSLSINMGTSIGKSIRFCLLQNYTKSIDFSLIFLGYNHINQHDKMRISFINVKEGSVCFHIVIVFVLILRFIHALSDNGSTIFYTSYKYCVYNVLAWLMVLKSFWAHCISLSGCNVYDFRKLLSHIVTFYG